MPYHLMVLGHQHVLSDFTSNIVLNINDIIQEIRHYVAVFQWLMVCICLKHHTWCLGDQLSYAATWWTSPISSHLYHVGNIGDMLCISHYSDVIMVAMTSQITSASIVYWTASSTAQRKLQSSAALAFVRGIHWGPVNSPHKRPVTRKMSPFDDVIM